MDESDAIYDGDYTWVKTETGEPELCLKTALGYAMRYGKTECPPPVGRAFPKIAAPLAAPTPSSGMAQTAAEVLRSSLPPAPAVIVPDESDEEQRRPPRHQRGYRRAR